MNTQTKLEVISNEQTEKQVMLYRFDIFKGVADGCGKIQKIKTVGSAYLREGLRTYTIHLKTFLLDTYYLLQNTKSATPDFVILTRQPSRKQGRKYHWNNVGGGIVLDGVNQSLMKLEWDFFGDDIYMTLAPERSQEVSEQVQAA